ncbi:MAG: signal recognition particle-docking protein FtsY [Candidatus Aenigmarchaeota archaeon]|nr:signal recognition particle-docking protein FtsY [Candidatus Aenigmarchaeota archaeon]
MFGLLKKKLRESVEKLTKKAEEPIEEKEEFLELKEPPKPKETSFLKKITKKVTEKEFTEKDVDNFFTDLETELLQANVALEVIDFLKENLKKEFAGKPIKRTSAKEFIRESFENAVFKVLNQKQIKIEDVIKKAKSEKRPALFVFLGFNGAGKTTCIGRLAYKLKKKYKFVFAAADTFRSAAQEQLEVHGNKLGMKVIKHQYNADPAAVVFDAKKYAEANRCDIVLADTAGRTHVNKDLADELKKICKVNKPDMKILVLDSLTGNDIISQGRMFDEMVNVDAIILTKVDIDTRGGAIMSAAFVLKKPILFLGTGQEYNDLEEYDPKKISKLLVS